MYDILVAERFVFDNNSKFYTLKILRLPLNVPTNTTLSNAFINVESYPMFADCLTSLLSKIVTVFETAKKIHYGSVGCVININFELSTFILKIVNKLL